MDAKYEEGIKRLKQCWKEQKHAITDEEKAAMKSFRGYFLSSKSEQYSHEVALRWLSANQVAWDDEKYKQNRKLIYELNDAVTNSTIRMDYDFLPTAYDTLSSDLQSHLILYRNDLLSRFRFRASRDQLVHCISFAAYLMNEGILYARDISTELISRYHAFADTIGDTYICLYSVRYFLQFLADHGIIAGHIPFVLTSPLQARATSYAIRKFSKEVSSFETIGMSSDVYWQKANDIDKEKIQASGS